MRRLRCSSMTNRHREVKPPSMISGLIVRTSHAGVDAARRLTKQFLTVTGADVALRTSRLSGLS
jgi:hypothetical protein